MDIQRAQGTKIALLGCGTVGSGLLQLLDNFPDIEIVKIFVKNLKKKRSLGKKDLSHTFTDNIDEILNDPSIAIIIEVMGGVEETQKILLKAIQQGKSIVTANKDLLALRGESLFEAAKQNNVSIYFEAAVAGGIPIINTLKQSLRGNKINKLYGIINGTTNYMLTAMERDGVSYETILKKAQELGFAEADPSSDVDGHDAGYKIAILASIIAGQRIDLDKVYREGIRDISLTDIQSAKKRGYRIKLLGIADNSSERLDVRVHPVFVPLDNPLASVHAENNAILIEGNAVQELTLVGKGAGSLPTASSVLGDLLMLASQLQSSSEPNPQHICAHSDYADLKPIEDVKNGFYIRVAMRDDVGVLASLGSITAKHKINVKFIDQYDAKDGEAKADFIIDPATEKQVQAAIEDIKKLDSIQKVESVIRVLS